MSVNLLPFQKAGADWLAERRRALLCDEMGLGKTCQAVVAADRIGARDVLVLAPASVCVGWQREFARWSAGRPPARLVRGPADADGAGVRVVSYDKARDPAALNALRSRRWDLLICDEADMLKADDAARTRAVLGPRLTEEHGLLGCADRAWGLTGTPMPNRADDLWTLLRAFAPEALRDSGGVLMSRTTFVDRYCQSVLKRFGRGAPLRRVVVGLKAEAVPELRERVRPAILRRKMDEVLPTLPPMSEEAWPLPGEEAARELAVLLGDDMADMRRGLMAALLTLDGKALADRVGQMLQILSDEHIARLRRLTGGVKARVLGPILAADVGRTEKVVVMGWHTEVLDALQDALAPFGCVRLDGSTAPAARQEAIDAFQTDPDCRVFLGQIQAAGAGITLTAASEIVFAELSWSPRDNAQAARRIRRIGQNRPTRARYPHLVGTVDEAVVAVLRRKTQDIRTVLEE